MTGSRTVVYDPAALFKARQKYIEICCRLMMSRADAKASKAAGLWQAYLCALLASYTQDLWWAWSLIAMLGLVNFYLAERRYQRLKDETPKAMIAYLTQDFEQMVAAAESKGATV